MKLATNVQGNILARKVNLLKFLNKITEIMNSCLYFWNKIKA